MPKSGTRLTFAVTDFTKMSDTTEMFHLEIQYRGLLHSPDVPH